MARHELPIHGRGSSDNPPNRFDRIVYEPDPENSEDTPGPTTQFYRDATRSIISTNDSPDVGFTASVNPYRGCEHGCAYCLSGETLILMADGGSRPLRDLRAGDEVYGTERRGWYRRYVRTRVLAHWQVRRAAYRITLRDGTTLVAGADHRFLTERGWKFVTGADCGPHVRPHLTTNNKLMGIGAFASPPKADRDYRQGYLCGIVRGDALLGSYNYDGRRRACDRQYQFRLALVDDEALQRSALYLSTFGIPTHRFLFQETTSTTKSLQAIRTHARGHVERIRELIAWPSTPPRSWCLGFLAGTFDAEGGFNEGVLQISNTDRQIIDCTSAGLTQFGFSSVIEVRVAKRKRPIYIVRLVGGLKEQLRFFHTVGTAITRKRDFEGQAVKSMADLRIASIEPLNRRLCLYDITTGTGDFIANGVVSHNCYARPTHEFLGLSAGLDFESRILVKEDAPQLLRRELASPRWQPQVLSFSGVTDPYQPIERRLQLTRRCLEVLAEFRNPAGIVTKSRLVTRDLDILKEMAGFQGIVVFLSVTTLDGDLARKLEPRAAAPLARLGAIEELAAAGIPVGVLTAPVIPGLNDHELPALLSAAAKAGARFAGHVLLRLPYAVAPLFERWLEQHYPERKEKVLSRIRDMRGGRLNDSRFVSRMAGEGVLAEQIHALFEMGCRRAGLNRTELALSTASFRPPGGRQLSLFDE